MGTEIIYIFFFGRGGGGFNFFCTKGVGLDSTKTGKMRIKLVVRWKWIP